MSQKPAFSQAVWMHKSHHLFLLAHQTCVTSVYGPRSYIHPTRGRTPEFKWLVKKEEKKTQLCNDKQKDTTLTNMMHSLNFRVAVAHVESCCKTLVVVCETSKLIFN